MATIPQVIRIRAIQIRAPILCSSRLLGNFKDEVAEKENPDEQSKLLAGDTQLIVHRQRGEPNVDPVEIGNDVEKQYEGKNPDPHFPNRLRFDGDWSGRGTGSHVHLMRDNLTKQPAA